MSGTSTTALLSIGEVAERSGVADTALRYYERIGLLRPVERVGGKRRYDEKAVARLAVIGLCKAAGFSLDEIAILYDDRSPARARSRELAEAKLAEIDAQLARLQEARAVVEWGLRCTCPTLDACTCGLHVC